MSEVEISTSLIFSVFVSYELTFSYLKLQSVSETIIIKGVVVVIAANKTQKESPTNRALGDIKQYTINNQERWFTSNIIFASNLTSASCEVC